MLVSRFAERCPEFARGLARPAAERSVKRGRLRVLQEERDVTDAQARILQECARGLVAYIIQDVSDRRALAVGVVLMSASVHAQSRPTMEQTKDWLEWDGRELMRAERAQAGWAQRGTRTDAVETLMLDKCNLSWRMVATSGLSETGAPEPVKDTHNVWVPLGDLDSVQVTADFLLTGGPGYRVQLAIRNPLDGATATHSVNGENPRLIRYTGLPVQTPEDGQRVANAITHAADLCGVALGADGSVF